MRIMSSRGTTHAIAAADTRMTTLGALQRCKKTRFSYVPVHTFSSPTLKHFCSLATAAHCTLSSAMYKALILAALVGFAAAQTGPAICTGDGQKAHKLTNFGAIQSVRFQSLDNAAVRIAEVAEPTLVLYSDTADATDPFRSLNVENDDGKMLIGAANGDRSQCVHLLLPAVYNIEEFIADDKTELTLEGAFTAPMLKLLVVSGNFYRSNNGTKFNLGYMLLNNTGTGGVFFWDHTDAAKEVEIINNGNGETVFMGTSGMASIYHQGIGNVLLGDISKELLVNLIGQGDIATTGSMGMEVQGFIKHPYRVIYAEGKCGDALEAIMGNPDFKPCKQASEPFAALEALLAGESSSTVSIAG